MPQLPLPPDGVRVAKMGEKQKMLDQRKITFTSKKDTS